MSQGQQLQLGSRLNVVPGSTVVVRDEEWLVTAVEQAGDGDDQLLTVQGLTPLVRGTTATFYESLEFDPSRPAGPGNGIVLQSSNCKLTTFCDDFCIRIIFNTL